jgi:hypothetical protein
MNPVRVDDFDATDLEDDLGAQLNLPVVVHGCHLAKGAIGIQAVRSGTE